MIEEKEYFEDDSYGIPDEYIKMPPDRLKKEIEELYREMKMHPQKKEKVKSKIKCILD